MHETHKDMHAHTAIVIHSTVRFSVSYPVSAPGNCPNKGALHSFTLLLSHQLFFLLLLFQILHLQKKGGKRELLLLLANQGCRPQTNKVLLQWIMLTK